MLRAVGGSWQAARHASEELLSDPVFVIRAARKDQTLTKYTQTCAYSPQFEFIKGIPMY